MQPLFVHPIARCLALLLLFITFSSNNTSAQSPQRTIYYVDSVFIYKMDSDDNKLVKKDIETMRYITHPDTLAMLQLLNIDTVVYVITHAYAIRPDSLRRIPSLKNLVMQEKLLYEKDTSAQPYTGPFLDYYLNGTLKTRGEIKEGYIQGYANSYFRSGALKTSHYYNRSAEDGMREEYYPDGSVKRRGKVSNGYMEGFWQEWHSTGKLKREVRFLHSAPFYSEGENIFYSLLAAIPRLIQVGEYKIVLEKLKDCKAASPDTEEIYYYYSLLYSAMGKTADALEALNHALLIEPLYAQALKERALVTAIRIKEINASDTAQIATLKASICADINKATELEVPRATFGELLQQYCAE